jgi:nicotinate-nucleotide adenylyltransferase
MSDILLFGLSADMPHKGHIEWITKLKKTFPTHTIIVMPCSANPLGKSDEFGNTIYPSNGYLRWQMLYDFYKDFDPEIIVSQYEVAINTPSTTIVTVRHLMHTNITDIRKQRGYIYQDKSLKPINEITLAVGSELFNELPLWHDWQEIIAKCKIVIMKRAGYADINPNCILDLELKRAFTNGVKNGSIIELGGPQVDVSSRSLKKLIREGACDTTLLKYIPRPILTYIRSNIADFSASYYQNPKAIEIFNLAMKVYRSNVQHFDKYRNNELSAYVRDLRDIENINHWQDFGYKLNNCRLIINLEKADHAEMHTKISNWMQSPSRAWFKTVNPYNEIITPTDFKADFKILGEFGPNLATDAVIFIKHSRNSLKLLTIRRADDTRTPAIPGGINESSVFKTCTSELLEECFSNSLFADDSKSNLLINDIYSNKISTEFKLKLHSVLERISNNTSLKEHSTISEYINQIPEDIYPSKAVKLLLTINIEPKLLVKLKCCLYEELLPEQFNIFSQFIKYHGKIGPKELSTTDERNTNLAWMLTQTVRFVLDDVALNTLLQECGLELSGGDDAEDATLMSIVDFCKEPNRLFSIHGFLVLRDLAKMIESGDIHVTKSYVDDLSKCITK